MKVLSIGTDRKLFEEGSAVLLRQKEYAEKMKELHIVVFTLKKEGFEPFNTGNLFVYPTNSIIQWFYVQDAVRICKKIFTDNKFTTHESVVSTQDPFQTGFVGAVIARKFAIPLQIQVHTDFLSTHFSKSFLNKVRIFISNLVIPQANGIRVVSHAIKDSLEKKYKNIKNKIQVLPVFVDVEKKFEENGRYVIDMSHFDFTILVASRLEKEKRIDIAINSFKKVTEKFPKAGMVIVGDGSMAGELKKLTHELDLSKNIEFFGWAHELAPYYLQSDIFLLTSEYEGYGMTLVEAGATGLPIVTTKVGLAKTDLFKSGVNSFVCEVGDVDCLANSMIDLITNESKRKLFKDNMQASIKSTILTKGEYVNKYVGLLENLIK